MSLLPAEEHISRISVRILIDLGVTRRTEKYEILERIRVERFIWSVLVARALMTMRYKVRHFSNVRVAAHFWREQRNEAARVLAMARCLGKQA